MKSSLKEKISTLILCTVITGLSVYFLSRNNLLNTHPTLIVSLIVFVAVVISNIISSKLLVFKDK